MNRRLRHPLARSVVSFEDLAIVAAGETRGALRRLGLEGGQVVGQVLACFLLSLAQRTHGGDATPTEISRLLREANRR